MAPGTTVTNARQERTPVEHLTPAERAGRGKAARVAVPRERIAEFEPAASVVIAGRDRGFTAKEPNAVVAATAAGYRAELQELAAMRELDVWYPRFDIKAVMAASKALARPTRQRTTAAIAKARTRDSLQAFSKLTHMVDGEPRIVSDPPLIVPVEELVPTSEVGAATEHLHDILATNRRSPETDRRHLIEQFRIVHVARNVVGVGSVGTRDWIVLLLGRDDSDPRVCGQALALAHARSGDRVAISSYLGKSAAFEHALAAFAEAYADQNQRDYEALRTAVDTGRVTAEVGL